MARLTGPSTVTSRRQRGCRHRRRRGYDKKEQKNKQINKQTSIYIYVCAHTSQSVETWLCGGSPVSFFIIVPVPIFSSVVAAVPAAVPSRCCLPFAKILLFFCVYAAV